MTMATIALMAIAALLLSAAPMVALAQPAAPGPSAAGPLNITAILVKGGNYNFFVRMLSETRIDQQINSQLNNSYNGLTVFAPTDNAFNSLKSGTINSLTQQEQIELILFHVLPRFYSINTFETATNPLSTQASGNNGVFTLNVTTSNNQANVSTGVVETQINSNGLYNDFPLAVYSVEKVLLPYDIFGAKPPASPPPAPSPATKSSAKSSPAETVAAGPSVGGDNNNNNTGAGGRVGWSGLVAAVGLLASLVAC